MISIHAPAWGATVLDAALDDREAISIHAPAWGATVPVTAYPRADTFQSTHPRGVRLRNTGDNNLVTEISINAPAWGATIPTLTHTQRQLHFNPRTRVGCDPRSGRSSINFGGISIHAPAWGATAKVYKIICKKK